MSEFQRTFLNEDWESLPDVPRLYLGAFGKHPGWNDHLDDIGLVTTTLADLRRTLYQDGIAGGIETGFWSKIPEDKHPQALDHEFVWRRPNECLVGTLWPSRDGKGRSLYPMVLAVQCVGQPWEFVAGEVLPALRSAAEACRTLATAAEVIGHLGALQETLRARTHTLQLAERLSGQVSSHGIGGFSNWARDHRELLARVQHHLQGQMGPFAPDGEASREAGACMPSRVLRLPVPADLDFAAAANVWLGYLATQIDPSVPMLAIAPKGGTWMDVIVGEPTARDFLVLRSPTSVVPLTTDIPYEISETTRLRLSSVFDELSINRLPTFSLLNGETLEHNRAAAQDRLAAMRPGARKGFLNRIKAGAERTGLTRLFGK